MGILQGARDKEQGAKSRRKLNDFSFLPAPGSGFLLPAPDFLLLASVLMYDPPYRKEPMSRYYNFYYYRGSRDRDP